MTEKFILTEKSFCWVKNFLAEEFGQKKIVGRTGLCPKKFWWKKFNQKSLAEKNWPKTFDQISLAEKN